MSAQQTPGPWAVDQNYGSGCLHVWSPKRELAIARISDVHPRAEDYANARLIAAAPELLEALREVLLLHIAHHNHPIHAAARTAIAKAKGND